MKKFERFRNMSDGELANYYVDVCAYRESAAIEEQKAICKIIVERFVDKYADKPTENDCDNQINKNLGDNYERIKYEL